MTVEKAIEEVQFNMSRIGLGARAARRVKESKEMAIEALKKVQAFEAIGTIEEFKVLKEKNTPKKPDKDEFDYGEGFVCGECESFLHYVDDDDEHIRTNYCCHCGTKIDWSE